jgi:hypothetical protein
MWRPYEGREAAYIFYSRQGGLVPATEEEVRLCCSEFSGGVKGPDGFFLIICRVFLAKSNILVILSLLYRGLFCKI